MAPTPSPTEVQRPSRKPPPLPLNSKASALPQLGPDAAPSFSRRKAEPLQPRTLARVAQQAESEWIVERCKAELERGPSNVRAARLHLQIARNEANAGRMARHCRLALELLPDYPPALRLLRELTAFLGNHNTSIALLDGEIAKASNRRAKASLFVEKARAQWAAAEPQAARRSLLSAIELDTKCGSAIAMLRQQPSVGAEQDIAKALAAAAESAPNDPKLRSAWLARRAELRELRATANREATELYAAAIALAPKAGGNETALRRLLSKEERWADLIRSIEDSTAPEQPRWSAYNFLQVSRVQSERLGMRTEAIESLERANQALPRDSLILSQLERLQTASGDEHGLAATLLDRIAAARQNERPALLLRLAKLRFRLGDQEEGLQHLQAALAIDINYEPAWRLACQRLRHLKRYREAHTIYARVADAALFPATRADALVQCGLLLESKLGDTAGAIKNLQQAWHVEVGNQDAFQALSRLYRSHQRYGPLQKLYESAIETAERSLALELLIELGSLAESLMQAPDLAQHCYRRAATVAPEDLRCLHGIQRIAMHKKDYASLAAAIEHEASLSKAGGHKARLLQRAADVRANDLRDPEGAVELLTRAWQLDNARLPVLQRWAQLLDDCGRHEELVTVLERQLALSSDPDQRCRLLLRLAETYELALGDTRKAIENYRGALEMDPCYEPALRRVGCLLRARGEYGQLCDILLNEALSQPEPNLRADALFRLGEVRHLRLGHQREALAAFDEALDMAPQHIAAEQARIELLDELQDYARLAEVHWLRAQNPGNGSANVSDLLRAGQLWRDRLGDFERAAAAYEKVLEDAPRHAGSLLALEEIYARLGRLEDLATIYLRQSHSFESPVARATALELLSRLLEGELKTDASWLVAIYQQLIEINVDSPRNLGWALEGLERHSRNRPVELQRALLLQAKNASHPARAAACYEQLGLALERDTNPKAAQAYRAALERDPESLTAMLGLTRCGKQQGSIDDILDGLECQANWTTDPVFEAELLVEAARVSLDDLADLAKAVVFAERALGAWPDHSEAAELLQHLLPNDKDTERLVPILRRAASRANAERANQLRRLIASRLAANDELSEALAVLAHADESKDFATFIMLGELYLRQRYHLLAKENFEAALAMAAPGNQTLRARLLLAAVLIKHLNEPQQALEHLHAAETLAPDDAQLLELLTFAHLRSGNLSGAVAAAKRMVAAAGDQETKLAALLKLARVYRKDGLEADARSVLELAISIEGPDGSSATQYKQLLTPESSWEGYRRALEGHLDLLSSGQLQGPSSVAAYLALDEVLAHKLARPKDAIARLRAGLHASGGDPLLREALIKRLLEQKRFAEGRIELREFIDASPRNAFAWHQMVEAFLKDGKKRAAGHVAQVLLLLGEASDQQAQLAVTSQNPAIRIDEPVVNQRVIESVAAPGDAAEPELSQLLYSLRKALPKLYPDQLEQLGVVKPKRLDESDTLSKRTHALAYWFDLEELVLVESPTAGHRALPVVAKTATLVLGSGLRELPASRADFNIAEALVMHSRGLAAMATLPPEEVDALLLSLAPGHDDKADNKLRRRLQKALPRKLRAQIAEQVQGIEWDKLELDAWRSSLATTAIRLAAMLTGDVAAAVAELESREDHDPHDKASELLRFWATSSAVKTRELLG